MERVDYINPDRISWCAEQVGMSLGELSSELGISRKTFSHLFEGKGGLTFKQLQRLSKYFGRSVFFFLEQEPVREEVAYTTQFRTLANQKPELSLKVRKIIRQAEEQRERYLSLLEELGSNEIPRFTPPDVEGASVEAATLEIRHWLGIEGENSFEEYRDAIERVGILVFRSNGYTGQWQIPKESSVLGFNLYDEVSPIIFVRKQLAEARQTFTLAHEFGHLVLHRSSSIDDEYDLESAEGAEREANRFAGAFLVPRRVLELVDMSGKPDEPSEYEVWLSPVCQSTGASTEVVLRRLLEFHRISSSNYRDYRNWKSKQKFTPMNGGNRGYRHREPKHLFGDRFVRTVLDAVRAKAIPITKASKYLDNLKIRDIHALEEYYAGL